MNENELPVIFINGEPIKEKIVEAECYYCETLLSGRFFTKPNQQKVEIRCDYCNLLNKIKLDE